MGLQFHSNSDINFQSRTLWKKVTKHDNQKLWPFLWLISVVSVQIFSLSLFSELKKFNRNLTLIASIWHLSNIHGVIMIAFFVTEYQRFPWQVQSCNQNSMTTSLCHQKLLTTFLLSEIQQMDDVKICFFWQVKCLWEIDSIHQYCKMRKKICFEFSPGSCFALLL